MTHILTKTNTVIILKVKVILKVIAKVSLIIISKSKEINTQIKT